MQYALVYDVMNAGPPWFGVAFAIILLLAAVASFLEILERVRVSQTPPRKCRPGTIVVFPLAVVIALFLATAGVSMLVARGTYEAFVLREHCHEWVQAEQYQVTEGIVADYEYSKAGPRFRVAGLPFDLLDTSAGFTGRFNIPGSEAGELRDGLRVRLAHREGIILRVEIAPEKGPV
jgi:hypothetical protein